MRPGSPVRSPAEKVRLAHAVWNSGDRLAQAERTASTPAEVWVALATYTKAIQVNTAVATAPISGGPQAIFSRPQATVEQVNTAEVVGVGNTEEDAHKSVALHRSLFAQLQAEYTVTKHLVGPPQAAPAAAPADTYPCIGGCGRTLTGGVSYCDPCRQKQWASSGWRGDD